MGLRFHRVFSILPGLRINLSKTGLSTSVGPRGADVNIGRHGVTTNAGIPGTGLSYRQKMGSRGSKLGIIALIGALAFAVFKNVDKIGAFFHPHAATSAAILSHRTKHRRCRKARCRHSLCPSRRIGFARASETVGRGAQEGSEGAAGTAARPLRRLGRGARWSADRLDAGERAGRSPAAVIIPAR
jgi:hypothetical protein